MHTKRRPKPSTSPQDIHRIWSFPFQNNSNPGECLTIKTISSREVYRNPWTSVREDVIERANGVRGIYGVVDKDPATIIIPLDVTAEGEFVYLIEQFRYTVGARHWELPQGGWETAEVVPEEMARGELKEETGLTAERMTH